MLVLCLLVVGVTPILGTSIASVTTAPYYAGVIIDKRYLIVPPVVLDGLPIEEYKVRAGTLKASSGGRKFDIEGYIPHPFYDPQIADFKGRTGKDNRDNIALLIVAEDLPIGSDNIDKAAMADEIFVTEGPAYVLNHGLRYRKDVSITNITIHSKAECEAKHRDIDCSRNLWGSASDTCDIGIGSPVFSDNTLIGTMADVQWCKDGKTDLFINSIPYYNKWIRRTIKDEELYVA